MNEVFDIAECPDPRRNELRFKSHNIHTVRHEIETVALVGLGLWIYIHSEIKYYIRHQNNLGQK